LFPDTAYGCESGGDPERIPELTREEYLDYHKKYYHPSNSYIYLYGDMDMAERLEYLDREYLSGFDCADVPGITEMSAIKPQQAFTSPVDVSFEYAITEDEPEQDNSYVSYNLVTGTSLDAKLCLGMQVLDYVLVMSPGARLKLAMLREGLGDDVYSSYESSLYQPVYSIILKGASEENKGRFLTIIREECERLCREGINKDELLAGINYYEFKYREADFGSFPKGLIYSLQMMDSWLYDENEPFMHIECGGVFDSLKEDVNSSTGYFEGLIRKYVLDNTHAATVTLNPRRGLTELQERQADERLQSYKSTLSREELEELVRSTAALKAYQEEPSPQEDLKTIPMLSVNDIRTTPAPLKNREMQLGGTDAVWHDIFTNGIAYVNLSFDCAAVTDEDIPYMGLLCNCLGLMDTKKYTYGELSTQIDMHTGGIFTNPAIYVDRRDRDAVSVRLNATAKALYPKIGTMLELMGELLLDTRFDDYVRLKEIIDLIKSRMEASMMDAGHKLAMLCATAQFSRSTWYSNRYKGYDFYLEICEMHKNYDTMKEDIAGRLSSLVRTIFCKGNLLVSITADEDGREGLAKSLSVLTDRLFDGKPQAAVRSYEPHRSSLGLTSSSQVQYVARCGNFRDAGYEYTGALKVLKVIFSYEYLWKNIRVKGGAYGCMSGFSHNGDSYLVSYRDPNLSKTVEVYENAPDYVRNFTVTDRDMEKFIIGTIGGMDTPMTPATDGTRSFGAYMVHATMEDYQRERDEVLHADQDSIRALAGLLEGVVSQNYFCVVGNAGKIQGEGKMFDRIEALVR
jgi:hypothetical protein